MPRRKKVELPPTIFDTTDSIEVDGWVIEKGDMIKIVGEYGTRFKFNGFVTNTLTGSQWIDCFEMFRGQVGPQRSFKISQVKRIPRKRGSGLVRRRKSNTTS